MEQKFYSCRRCGNIIAMIRDCGVSVKCCGEDMQRIISGSCDASGEKHTPIYTVCGNEVAVKVGIAAHPMTSEHYIELICIETACGAQYRWLRPGDEPAASFCLCEGEELKAVYALCNTHGLWKK